MTDDAGLTADLTGKDTLQSFSRAHRFNRWMFDQIAPWTKGNVLEAGSGIGNMSKLILDGGFRLVLTEIMSDYLTRLRRSFSNHPQVDGIYHLDLADKEMISSVPGLTEKFDTVIALNVVEHIENDELAIHNCGKLLKPGGSIIILVPAFPFLFNGLDTDLQHYRRYTKKTIGQLLKSQGFRVIHTRYFNFAGMLGWYFSGTMIGNKKIPRSQLRVFEKLVPFFRVLDLLIFRSAGVSVIAVGEKITPQPTDFNNAL